MPHPDVIYMRVADLSGHQQPDVPTIIADAKVLSALPLDALVKIGNTLESYPDFLNLSELSRVVQECAPDKEQAKAVSAAMSRLLQVLQHTKTTVSEMLDRIAAWKSELEDGQNDLLTQDDLNLLRSRLPLVLKNYEAIVRQRKAERLAGVTGLRVDTIDAICDLRPVYNTAHTDIVGVIPLTTLKIAYTGASGFPEAIEVMLTDQQVGEMADKTTDAVKKLQLLRDWAKATNKPIPITAATKLPSAVGSEAGESR